MIISERTYHLAASLYNQVKDAEKSFPIEVLESVIAFASCCSSLVKNCQEPMQRFLTPVVGVDLWAVKTLKGNYRPMFYLPSRFTPSRTPCKDFGLFFALPTRSLRVKIILFVQTPYQTGASLSVAKSEQLGLNCYIADKREPKVYACFFNKAKAFIFFQRYLFGETLFHRLISAAPPLKNRLLLFLDILHQVECLHKHGVIHLDIKLENIFMDRAKGNFLVDFGTATKTWSFCDSLRGTFYTMAPEMLCKKEGSICITPAQDIWALGVVLYYLRHNRTLHKGLDIVNVNEYFNEFQKNRKVMERRISAHLSPKKFFRSLPRSNDGRVEGKVDRLIADLLKPKPSKRPSLMEIITRVENICIVD